MAFPDDVLTDEEEVVLHLHPHAKAAVRPILVLLVALAAVILVWVMLPPTTGGLIGVCVVGAVALFIGVSRGVWPLLVWRSTHYVFTDEHAWLRRIWPGALAFSTFRNSDDVLESGQYALWVQWETKAGGGGWIEPKWFVEDVAEPFSIGGEVDIPAGRYTFADLQLALSMGTGAKLRTGLDARAGTYFDGTRAQVILTPTWNVSPHLELGGDWQWTRLRFDDRDQEADIHLARLRIRAAANARASGNAFLQYNSTVDKLALSFRLRYNFAEGTDLWIVYDEALSTDRVVDPEGPVLPLSTGRALVVKYTHTFEL